MCAFAFLTALVLGVPASKVAVGIVEGLLGEHPPEPALLPSYRLLWPTLGWSGLIGLLSAGFGLPLAWWSIGGGRWRAAVVLLPMLLPMAFVYAAYNQARAPGTRIGDWLALGPSWRAVLAGRLIAVVGLALWSSPVAAVVWRLVLRRLDPEVFEIRRLDGGRRWGVWRLASRLTAVGWCAAGCAVALLMIGSAVPLHLARVPTFSIELWLALDSAGVDGVWRVWLRAWPIVLIAGLGSLAAVLSLRAVVGQMAPSPARPRSGVLSLGGSFVTLVAAVGLPLVLLSLSLERVGTFGVLWRTEGEALRSSWQSAVIIGAAGGLVVWLVRVCASHAGSVSAALVMIWLVAALVPGVLVGSVLASAWSGVASVRDGAALLLLAHAARVLAWPALLGLWVAWSEPTHDRERRELDGAVGPWSIAVADGPVLAAACVAGAVLAGALSLAEIESSVVVARPGSASVARSMLGMLHFARYEHLSGLMLMQAGSTMVAVLVGIAATRLLRAPREPVGTPERDM